MFPQNLGTLVNLAEVNPQNIFLGGLEQNGDDGKYAYVWKDDVMQVSYSFPDSKGMPSSFLGVDSLNNQMRVQVIFHIATLMPNKDTDVHCNNKKKHIGNDYVIIVYNDSGEEYDLRTVKVRKHFCKGEGEHVSRFSLFLLLSVYSASIISLAL